MKKTIHIVLLVLVVSFSTIYSLNAADTIKSVKSTKFNDTKIIFANREIDMSSQPMLSVEQEGIEGIRNYMPVRKVLEEMGYGIKWDADNNAIVITDTYSPIIKTKETNGSNNENNSSYSLNVADTIKSTKFNDTKIIFANKEIDISSQPMLSVEQEGIEGIRNYIPVRKVLEKMGYYVAWDPDNNAIAIADTYNPITQTKTMNENNNENNNSITMTVKQNSVSDTEAIFTVTNSTQHTYTFGEDIYLEKKIENKWTQVERLGPIIENGVEIGRGIHLTLIYVPENSYSEFIVSWKFLYGELEKGEYKLSKEFSYPNGIDETFGIPATIYEKNILVSEFTIK